MPPKFLFFHWTTENYLEVQSRSNYLRFAYNSIVLSIGANILGLIFAIPAAWSMAFAPGKRTKDLLMWMLSTKMMPAVGVLVPMYLIFRDLHLLGRCNCGQDVSMGLLPMKVLIFGVTGMVGQAALHECLLAEDVESVLAVGRTVTGQNQAKLRERVVPDLFDVAAYEADLRGYDACFFCLGVSSAGMSEAAYTRLTFTLTTTVAAKLAEVNPQMTFVYVSGSGTDGTERGRTIWARVKGKTENTLLQMPFRAAYMLRPGFIVPMDGIQSRTRSYRIFYNVLAPVLPLLRRLFPKTILTTRELGQTMLTLARSGAPKTALEASDMRSLLEATASPSGS